MLLTTHDNVVGIDLAGRRGQGAPFLKHGCYFRVVLRELSSFLGSLSGAGEVPITHLDTLDLK
jgi:hypothetical protein